MRFNVTVGALALPVAYAFRNARQLEPYYIDLTTVRRFHMNYGTF